MLANDDGIRSTGIAALARRLADLGDVVVVAPDRERSATSHAFTLDRPLRCEEVEPGWFMVDGTPADCVYLGLLKICARKPDLVISGINHGFNLGSDVFYSGTVAGAVEAALRDVPAIAMSLEWKRGMHKSEEPFARAAEFAHALGRAVLAEGLPPGTLLNVNVPASDPAGAAAAAPRGYRWTGWDGGSIAIKWTSAPICAAAATIGLAGRPTATATCPARTVTPCATASSR